MLSDERAEGFQGERLVEAREKQLPRKEDAGALAWRHVQTLEKMEHYEMCQVITEPSCRGEAGAGASVLPCNTVTRCRRILFPCSKSPHQQWTSTVPLPRDSRILFESPPFSYRKKVLKRRLARLSPGTPLTAPLTTQRRACAWSPASGPRQEATLQGQPGVSLRVRAELL